MAIGYFGYIEGYYGRLLSWDERVVLAQCLGHLRLNAYLYAPKEDPYHRRQWKTPYPAEWLRQFSAFTNECRKASIHTIAGIAPGLSYDYTSKKDFTALVKKCADFMDAGAQALCLLMDDIPNVLPKPCASAFSSLGQAHGKLLCALTEALSRRGHNARMLFCPTVYTDQFIEKGHASSPYLADLAAAMPGDTVIFWTGPQVISDKLTLAGNAAVVRQFGGRVCLWDNIYANDYCPNRLFFGPFEKRDFALRGASSGIMLNPTGLLHTDMFLLSLLAAYRTGQDPQSAWQAAVAKLPYAKELITVAPFFNVPR
ncbi:MAG TPA: beta-N-acetylglucosaminidase domain-containing protein, partial [Chitinivibrionales bacterium]